MLARRKACGEMEISKDIIYIAHDFANDLREIPITTPSFWRDENQLDVEKFKHVFRSATHECIPLLSERLHILREAGTILREVNIAPSPSLKSSASSRFFQRVLNKVTVMLYCAI